MKKTDFSTIARKYDKNKYRHNIKHDQELESSINSYNGLNFKVLDLACGTGLYLQKQIEYFNSENIEWHGIDASEEMLLKAKQKVPNANLVKGLAERMPYSSNYFNFIINNFAFHHFTMKSKVLDEVERILDKDGIFKIHNIAIHEMTKWWVYQYFPSAYYEDLKRFWQKDLIFKELSIRGFAVELNINYTLKEAKIADLIEYARNRDISILTVIDDKEYMEGLEKMEHDLKKDSEAKIIVDFADLFIVGRKK